MNQVKEMWYLHHNSQESLVNIAHKSSPHSLGKANLTQRLTRFVLQPYLVGEVLQHGGKESMVSNP